MKIHKVTIILKNDIPNQPRFGFSFLLHEELTNRCVVYRAGRILGPLGDRLQMTDWNICSERSVRPVYRRDRMFPVHVDLGPWRHTTMFTVLDRKTSKEYHFSEMECESITMEEWTDTPDALPETDVKLLEAFLDGR